LLVDSTGLKLGDAGEWLIEKHGTSRRRRVDPQGSDALLDQIADPIASFTADGAYDQDQVTKAVAERPRRPVAFIASIAFEDKLSFVLPK
jgi:hypothetical protein